MPKTVSSQGLSDFIATGEPTNTFDDKGKVVEKKPLEQVLAETDAQVTEPPVVESDDDDDKDLPERVRKQIAKKHRAMKEAQEELAQVERLAESQFNERKLLEKRLADMEAQAPKQQVKAPEPPKAPTQAEFMKDGALDADAYVKALTDYAARTAVENYQKSQAEAQAKAQDEANQTALAARINEFAKVKPDFREVVGNSKVTLQNPVLEYINISEHGPQLAYYLALPENEKEATRIRALPAIKAIAEIGKLESSFEKPAAPVAVPQGRQVPEPITPISTGGNGTINTDPSKMTFKELRAYERSRKK